MSTPEDTAPATRPIRPIGWREVVALPELGLTEVRAKIDTGARSSALHATDLEPFTRDGRDWMRFHVPHDDAEAWDCEAPLLGERDVRNTSGTPETRPVIETLLILGARRWRIEVTLADRADMKLPLILGRTAVRRHRLLVDPGRSWLLGPPVLTNQKGTR